MKKKTPVAPKKLSAAIDLALEDLAIVEADKDYKVNMGKYHVPEITKCHVCFAGAVMAVTHQTPWEDHGTTGMHGDDWYQVYNAVDTIRTGNLEWALCYMKQKLPNSLGPRIHIVPYKECKASFKMDMETLSMTLKKEGL